ncbi:hypothetical protein HLH29_19120 [Gluconacetobacter tumulicola]|uniref:Uncharacterized protein n=2 Tax=Gluconacetobacter tumulicola TaxID=1017177 RepID=A0A7W4JHC0_9PROT|nr:hypothetical protein [Gluconacetobacter tumulicola]
MVAMRDRGARWRAAWPLVLLALVARLALGGLASPQAVFDDPLAQLASLSVFCDSDHPVMPGPEGSHHGEGHADGFILFAEALDTPALAVGSTAFVVRCAVATGMGWVFPPVRGPPFRHRFSLYPQGPPAQA